MNKKHQQVMLKRNEAIAKDIYIMDLAVQSAQQSVDMYMPGQFLNMYVEEKHTILPRPFSISAINKDSNEISLLYGVVGKGTTWLSKQENGKMLTILSPIGNGFSVEPHDSVALVGGELGVAPLRFLLDRYKELYPHTKVYVYLGFKDAPYDLVSFEKADELFVAVENADTENYFHGHVIGVLESHYKDIDMYYGCGSKGMLHALQTYVQHQEKPLELSLDPRMACGIGTCMGCVVSIKDEFDTIVYKKACADGPVFNGRDVYFE